MSRRLRNLIGRSNGGLPAVYAVPVGFAAMFGVGTAAAALDGRLTAFVVMVAVAAIVTAVSAVAEPFAAPPLVLIGWLVIIGFSRPPYLQLRFSGPLARESMLVLVVASLVGASVGVLARQVRMQDKSRQSPVAVATPGQVVIGWRRRTAGVLLAGVLLTAATVLLGFFRSSVSLDDELLIFLVAVVAVAVVGGFWPAVLAAIAAMLLLNWYFTPPLHTFTIDRPQNLLALLLFVTVAVAVSSVVHLAASRDARAVRASEEAESLLALAQTVLSGSDSPSAVLGQLTASMGGTAELRERVGGTWVRVARNGAGPDPAGATEVAPRADLMLVVAGQDPRPSQRLLDGYAAQAAAALDRERLRSQAAQAEALAEGNRMRNALLAAVSHDLRTPLASIKASVSSLRQPDVKLSGSDQRELLAQVENSADRLNAVIGNLLDMSRLRTASLQPYLRPAAIDEVAPLALRGVVPSVTDGPDGAVPVDLIVPDDLPWVLTDAGLLEHVLANLFTNAVAHSPRDRPPVMCARQVGDTVVLEVRDHGPGVPDRFKQRIFEPFERLEGARGTGVGLGLAVARGLAEAMGASIQPADTPGGGLTMRVTLPIAMAVAPQPAEQ